MKFQISLTQRSFGASVDHVMKVRHMEVLLVIYAGSHHVNSHPVSRHLDVSVCRVLLCLETLTGSSRQSPAVRHGDASLDQQNEFLHSSSQHTAICIALHLLLMYDCLEGPECQRRCWNFGLIHCTLI